MLRPFVTSNPPDARVLFENFGITFYYAQLVEDNLKLISAMGEIQGIVAFDRKKDLRINDSDDDLITACMGSLKEVLKKNRGPNDSKEFYELFDDANVARRLLAHRFFLEHAPDLLSEAGRLAINQHLSKLYCISRFGMRITHRSPYVTSSNRALDSHPRWLGTKRKSLRGRLVRNAKTRPKESVDTHRRPASPFVAGREFESAACAPPSLSAAVANLWRSAE